MPEYFLLNTVIFKFRFRIIVSGRYKAAGYPTIVSSEIVKNSIRALHSTPGLTFTPAGAAIISNW